MFSLSWPSYVRALLGPFFWGKLTPMKLYDEGLGWGPPDYVLDKMTAQKWCPRAKHLLQGQLGSNATMLLAALQSQTQTTPPSRTQDASESRNQTTSQQFGDIHLKPLRIG